MDDLITIGLMLFTAKLGGWLFEKLNQPTVLGQILGGIFIGLFLNTDEVIRAFSTFGVILLLFLAGLESDINEFKAVGRPSILIAGVGVLVSFVLGFIVSLPFYSFENALLLGAIMTPTSVSITVRVLMEMRRLRTKAGTSILAAAVIDDILGILALTIVISLLVEGNLNPIKILEIIVEVSGFLILLLKFGVPLTERFFHAVSRVKLPESRTAFSLVLTVFIAALAEEMQIASILGAYMTGLLIGQTQYGREITEKVSTLGYSLFIPIFFVEVGMSIDVSYVMKAGLFAIIYTLAAIVAKIGGCGLGAYLGGFDAKESLRIGVGMIPRMGVELAMLAIAMQAGVAGQDELTIAVFMVFVTTILTPPLLKYVYSKS
ncbi:cation:proton antiporter [Palaeococcus ferrophilus]|uniref:cation:proton antiporter n=1 Tax=Palaeococcus ferrophilus TaxID=83868 RepID=UPI00064F20A7|nr:cation:proton antiporter [Palaeococcus ferrophilus]